MSLLCLIVRHKPSPSSINRTEQGKYTALCEDCTLPIESKDGKRWKAAEPLA
jgi:hypothetical protein